MNTKLSTNLTLLAILLVLTAVISLLLPGAFLTGRNFASMGRQFPEYGLLSLANMLAMVTGGIDLSVTSVMSLSGVVSAQLLSRWESLPLSPALVIALGILLALAVSALCGLINGALIAYVRVPAIIATLGTQGLFLGISIGITRGSGIGGFPDPFLFIGNGELAGIPMQFLVFLAVALLVGLLLNRTRQGFFMQMYGSSPRVSRFSGVNNEAVLVRTYLVTGLLAGAASVIVISGVNSIRPGYGSEYLLVSVLIAILGGTDPSGGFGTALGLTLGIFILQVLQSGLNFLNFSPFFKKFMWGLLLLALMVFHHFRRRYSQRRAIRRSGLERAAASPGGPAGQA
jgi:ribose/xylose/arabinose/galactoside ABC-type transport system permease subunit